MAIFDENNISVQILNAVVLAENSIGHFYVQINKLETPKTNKLYDIWNGTRFILDRNLFPEKLDNFQGKVMK